MEKVPRPMDHGPWAMGHGAMAHGPWSMAHGPWPMDRIYDMEYMGIGGLEGIFICLSMVWGSRNLPTDAEGRLD